MSLPGAPAPAPAPAAAWPERPLLRLLGALVVGACTAPLALLAGVAGVFGAWALLLAWLGVVLLGAAAALGVVARVTGGTGGWRWGLRVAAGGLLVAGLGALAWERSGGAFGPEPLLWWAAVGAAFALAAAVATRRTRVAGLLVLAVLAVPVVDVLGPELPDDAARGCIASSHEEALRECG